MHLATRTRTRPPPPEWTRTLTAAVDYLNVYGSQLRLLSLYAHFFPTEWAASTADRIVPPGRAFSPVEREFFNLVEEHLFPISEDWIEGWDYEFDGRTDRVLWMPLRPQGMLYMDWDELDPSDYSLGVQLIMVLLGACAADDTELAAAPDGAQFAAILSQACSVKEPEGDRLIDACDALPSPLRHLATTLRYFDGITNNPWCDTSHDDPVEMDWTIAEVERIAAAWKEAQQIELQVLYFTAWLWDDPAHLEEVVSLWNSYRRPASTTG